MSLIKYNNRSLKDLTTTPAAAGGGGTGALVHIKTLTASTRHYTIFCKWN